MFFELHYCIILAISVLFLDGVLCDGICSDAVQGPQFVPVPDDCSSFFICYGHLQFRFSCESKIGPSKVFDPKSRTCVLQGSPYDHSACNDMYRKPFQKCLPGLFQTIPHEESCAKYYQCVGLAKPIKAECPYPRLYDETTGKCEIYMFVKCGLRKEPRDPCDYESNQCEDSGCIPCRQRFGTCLGYPDGPNPWKDKPWTPYFVICKDQRVILHGDCRQSGSVNIFNPFTRTCMPMSDLMKMAASAGKLL